MKSGIEDKFSENTLVTIDESLDGYFNDPIPQMKIDKCNDDILNINLLQVLSDTKKEEITKL